MNWVRVLVFSLQVLVFSLMVVPLRAGPPLLYRVYDKAPIHTVLSEIAALANRDILVSGEASGLVTTRLSGVSCDEALLGIAAAHGLVVSDVSGLLIVAPFKCAVDADLQRRFTVLASDLLERKVSLTLTMAHLPDLLSLLARDLDWTLIVRPMVGVRITARVREKPLSSVLSLLAQVSRLACDIRPRTVILVPVERTGSKPR